MASVSDLRQDTLLAQAVLISYLPGQATTWEMNGHKLTICPRLHTSQPSLCTVLFSARFDHWTQKQSGYPYTRCCLPTLTVDQPQPTPHPSGEGPPDIHRCRPTHVDSRTATSLPPPFFSNGGPPDVSFLESALWNLTSDTFMLIGSWSWHHCNHYVVYLLHLLAFIPFISGGECFRGYCVHSLLAGPLHQHNTWPAHH